MKDKDKKKVVNDKTYNSWGNRIGASNYKPNTYEDKKHFYDTYYKDALEAVSGTNISAEVLLAQAYKESNGGRQMPKNNMFGITSTSPEKSGIYKTTEYFDTDNYYNTDTIDGEIRVKDAYGTDRKLYGVSLVKDKNDKNYGRYKYEVDRYFREYENIKEGMSDYVSNFSRTDNYKEALTELNTTKDQEQFIKNISGSYATTNDYATTLLQHYNDFSGMKEKSNLNSSKLAGPKIATKAYQTNTANAPSSTIQSPQYNINTSLNKLSFAKGGLPDGQVEAEGRELVLRNSHGDMAIIPKKYRQEALDMIKEGCHGCLDNLISTLPKVSDYAKDGTVFGIPPSTANASSSTIQSSQQNINTSLIGKTRKDIPKYNPGQTFIGPDNRTDYERQRDQEAMQEYQNPSLFQQMYSAVRMIPRAVADPIQGVGQIFDAVGLGDTNIGKDLGNFNDEEAAYRYRNLNPNISAGEKFLANVSEGSEVAAWGATNFIPFEKSVINPVVKGLVGKGNYSSYVANKLYSPIVNQEIKQYAINNNLKDLEYAKEYFSKFGYEIPDNLINIANSSKETDNFIKNLVDQHNTFVRGVSTNFEKLPQTVKDILNKNNIDYINNPKAAAEYMATHIPGYTGYGRASLTNDMFNSNLDALYTSNSLKTAEGYTYGSGYQVKVKKPTDFSSKNRIDWINNNEIKYLKQERLTKAEQEMFDNEYYDLLLSDDYTKKSNELYFNKYKALEEQAELEKDWLKKQKYMMQRDSEINEWVKKTTAEKLGLDKKLGYNIDYKENNIIKTSYSQHKIDNGNPYAHYIHLGKPGEKIFDVVDMFEITPEIYKNKSRAHIGEYSKGLSMASIIPLIISPLGAIGVSKNSNNAKKNNNN